MHIDPATGLLREARFVPSPNYDERPGETPVDLLVIHNISLPPGEFGGPYIEQLFTNCIHPEDHPFFRDIHTLQVSSHLLIRRDGEVIQFVPFHKRAWHAGESTFQGRVRCNDFAIGIELEGTDTVPFTDIQYQKLHEITCSLRKAYPAIVKEHIVGHSDIAPQRKTDPGPAFDWQRYFAGLE
ncbi:MAG: 1,6-anhydro-N-acetylmuramyl-L-alanine amidase AmpD [Gammaproteobacteria bacterium]|nr:1,6-anhydro-N-acetylmuramyl-L-alanine amidase AmpD [Gammaproteobacteria bacterium]MDH5651133.1 1,6-anhydro-N-acetylmuramyl-L-alanine amidase AmpD [Gammaproteobacteria bacterium]